MYIDLHIVTRTHLKVPPQFTITRSGRPLGTNNLWNKPITNVSEVSYFIGSLNTNIDIVSMLHSSFLLPILLITSPRNQKSIKMWSMVYALSNMCSGAITTWSEFFASLKCAQYRTHCLIYNAMPDHQKRRAILQKVLSIPMCPGEGGEWYSYTTNNFSPIGTTIFRIFRVWRYQVFSHIDSFLSSLVVRHKFRASQYSVLKKKPAKRFTPEMTDHPFDIQIFCTYIFPWIWRWP